MERILILGIGNVLMGDEGVGVHAVQQLEKREWPSHVDLLDGGTGGFHLLSYFHDYAKIILIDATLDGKKAGTVVLREPRYSSEFPRVLSAHDIGLKDLIDAASITEKMPKIYLITVSIEDLSRLEIKLSEEVAAAMPEVEEVVKSVLQRISTKKDYAITS